MIRPPGPDTLSSTTVVSTAIVSRTVKINMETKDNFTSHRQKKVIQRGLENCMGRHRINSGLLSRPVLLEEEIELLKQIEQQERGVSNQEKNVIMGMSFLII